MMLHQQIDKMVVKLKEAKDIERDISGFVNDSNFMTKEEMEAEKERIKTKLQEPIAIQEKVKFVYALESFSYIWSAKAP